MRMGQVSLADGSGAEKHAQLRTGPPRPSCAPRGASMSNDTIRVLLADDHAMVREGLRLLLRTAPDIAIVSEAADGGRGETEARRSTETLPTSTARLRSDPIAV